MQVLRRTVVASVVLSFALTAGALAAPRDRDGNQEPRSREVRKTQEPDNPWVGAIITILDWLSIPPG